LQTLTLVLGLAALTIPQAFGTVEKAEAAAALLLPVTHLTVATAGNGAAVAAAAALHLMV
jgi:hypothetical protein